MLCACGLGWAGLAQKGLACNWHDFILSSMIKSDELFVERQSKLSDFHKHMRPERSTFVIGNVSYDIRKSAHLFYNRVDLDCSLISPP